MKKKVPRQFMIVNSNSFTENTFQSENSLNTISSLEEVSSIEKSSMSTLTVSLTRFDISTQTNNTHGSTSNSENITSLDLVEVSSTGEQLSVVDDNVPINIQTLTVPTSKSSEGKSKKHLCPFCKTLQTKFARHLQLMHKNEDEIERIIDLYNKHVQRLRIIDSQRKRADFMHNNTIPELNSGILIVSRQQQENYKKSSEDYVCCKTCKGFLLPNAQ